MEFKVNSEKNILFFGEDIDSALGYILFPRNNDGSHTITKVFVDESQRGQGLADKLMQEITNYAKGNNIKLNATCSYAKKWFEKQNYIKEN